MKQIPSYIRFTFLNTLVLLGILSVYKVIFYIYFSAAFDQCAEQEIQTAWWISTRFDIRLAVMLGVPMGLIGMVIPKRFFSGGIFRKINTWYFTIIGAVMILLLMGDIGNFAYTSERLNASLLEFAKNPLISLGMMWETYPVIWGGIILILCTVGLYFIFSKIYTHSATSIAGKGILKNIVWRILAVLLVSWAVYGSTSHYPLRWSEAYFSKDKSINSLALNPILFFYDSLNSQEPSLQMESFERYLPSMVNFLKSSAQEPFQRVHKSDSQRKPNIVFVMLESFGAAPMSAYGNPLPSTPLTDAILEKSLWFTKAFAPRSGTAFSVYGSTVGIPDVNQSTTASRIPQAIDQRILMDQLEGYKRYYTLGGSANWANIRAIFQGNVADIRVYEEGSYPMERRADVWGIDDYDLFKYSADMFDSLNRRGEPFVAYIQTSSNHRPYTVPESRDEYRPLKETEVDMELLKKAGFLELGQYNALRYLDFNIDRFIRRAQEQGWVENTVFVFFGDHNMSMNRYTHSPEPEFEASLNQFHVPIFVYAPSFVEPRKVDAPVSLIDVFPTGLSVAGAQYTNYTLGRDMSDTLNLANSYAFVYNEFEGELGLWLVGDTILYKTQQDTPDKYSVSLYKSNAEYKPIDITKEHRMRLDSLSRAFYHSAKYLYMNNKKR